MNSIITRIARLESERNPTGVIGIVVPCDPAEQALTRQRIDALRQAGRTVYVARIPKREPSDSSLASQQKVGDTSPKQAAVALKRHPNQYVILS